MKLILLFPLTLVSGIPLLNAQTNGIDQTLNFVTPPTGGQFIQWQAKAGRTYFLQISDPSNHLNKWNWSTVIERGNNQSISYEVDGTADKGFFRLQYTDQTATDLEAADFDGDRLTNLQEITPVAGARTFAARSSGGGSPPTNSNQTNPLDGDTDDDGTNDGDERDNGSDPNDPDSGGTPPGSDAGGAGSGSGDTGGIGNGGTGNPPSTADDFKLVYRSVFYHQSKYNTRYQPTVELYSRSTLTFFADKISADIPGIKVDAHSSGAGDDETIDSHPESETATEEYIKIGTKSHINGYTLNNYAATDASNELFALFEAMPPVPGDDLTKWKKILGANLQFGSSYRAPPHGGNNDWASKKSIAKYQFALIADQTSTRPRDIKRDFLQLLTIEGSIHKLADPPLVSRIFTILPSVNYSSHQSIGMIETPDSQISYEAGIRKNLTLVPVQMVDNASATGVDTTSRTASSTDIGYQANNWIMAPAGNVPATSQECNNAMKFQIPLPKGVRLKISCPGATPSPAIISPQVGNEPTVVWHGTANATSDKTPIFKVGTEESVVDLPIRVKVMKNRKVKVKVHLVARDLGAGASVAPDPAMVPTKAELEAYLNTLYAYQINTWFDVIIAPTTLVVPFNSAMTIGPQSHTPDQATIAGSISGQLSDNHINVFIIGKNGDLNGGSGGTTPTQATCWILGKSANGYASKNDLLATVGHEMGHVFFGEGHPNEIGPLKGVAPLAGTDHTKRLMCRGPLSNSSSRLIVKAEWDKAEDWLSNAEKTLTMAP